MKVTIYGKQIGATIETQNYAAEIRLRAERRLGEMLEKMPKQQGARGIGKKVEFPNGTPLIKDQGITKKESSRSQELAAVPEAEFEAALVVEPGKELNHNLVVKKVKENRQRNDRKKKRTEASNDYKFDDRIIIGDFRKHSEKVADGSLSLIFTDPPYDRKSEELFEGLAEFAKSKLADGGSIIFYAGHLQLPSIFKAFHGKLRYWWTCACIHSGQQALMREYGIRVGWKPMLWFVKGTRDEINKIVFDTISGGKEKDDHDWQQAKSEAMYWIESLCPKDGIVCDPFLGSATTAAAAIKLNRRWIGFEINPETAKIAMKRVSA